MQTTSPAISERTETLLRAITASRGLHWRWLNTLSFLEHIGSRKIFRANLGAEMNEMLLRHAAEEARHALFFKTMARREASHESDFAPDMLLCGSSANRYIQSLDSAVKRQIGAGHDFHCYLLTTYLIEVRAGSVYPQYQEVLKSADSPLSLRSVILEEEGHLAEMKEELDRHGLNATARLLGPVEESLFARFLHRLEQACKASVLACPSVPVF